MDLLTLSPLSGSKWKILPIPYYHHSVSITLDYIYLDFIKIQTTFLIGRAFRPFGRIKMNILPV